MNPGPQPGQHPLPQPVPEAPGSQPTPRPPTPWEQAPSSSWVQAPGSPQPELAPAMPVAQETRSYWRAPSNPGSRTLTHPVTLLLLIKVLRLCNQ